jgi:receptor protein-tyrosine kinase
VLIAATLAGLLLGFGIALMTDSLGGKIRSEDDLSSRTHVPVLARVPRLTPWLVREYFGRRTNLPPAAWEAYRTLRTNLLRSAAPGEPPVILVTSAMPGEGKTFTAINLAITLAAQNSRVLLVDGDFRRPMIASFFGVAPPRDGFRATFIEHNYRKVLRDAPGYKNLQLMLPTLRNLGQIDELDSERVAKTFDQFRTLADVVVVDSAPADVSDPLILASAADMILIAVRVGYTRRERLESLQEALSQHVVSATGIVMTVRESAKEAVHGSTMPVALDFNRASSRIRRQSASARKS